MAAMKALKQMSRFQNAHVHCRRQLCLAAARSKKSDKEGDIMDEPHLYFDHTVLHVVAGRGGTGERSENRKAKQVPNFKYKAGKNQPKYKTLPPAEPADGGNGGNVVLFVDTQYSSLLHLQERKHWKAKSGPNGAAAANNRAGRPRYRAAPDAPDLRLPVPPGTVARRKRTGKTIADLVKPGQEAIIARGGYGGYGIARARQYAGSQKHKRQKKQKASRDTAADSVIDIEDDALDQQSEFELTRGSPGEEVSVELLMRVVADISLIGLPNAGKSSFLRAATRAAPSVQPYPFTTLMPNLGVATEPPSDTGTKSTAPNAILADLPGLIEDAHRGRGLGREFLRHVRRTFASVIIIDAASAHPVNDFRALREELRMYNPEYARKPYVLALNKADMLGWDTSALDHIELSIRAACEQEPEDFARPRQIFRICAQSGENVENVFSSAREAVAEVQAQEHGLGTTAVDAPAYKLLKHRNKALNGDDGFELDL